jgi:hypothetical protein
MANVVNYMILLLIFVFDPLAVALVLITNKVFMLETGYSVEEEAHIVEPVKPKRSRDKKWFNHLKNKVTETASKLRTKKDTTKELLEEIVEELQNDAVTDAVTDAVNEGVTEGLNEGINQVKKEPVVPKGKIELEDIKEIKEGNRGFSVKVPEPKSNNMVERIGSNKIVKDGDNNKVIFRRD